jgi:pimeloyl-ACP methyl ester carboxylesterase
MRTSARSLLLILANLSFAVSSACAQPSTAAWRYSLHPGDHLIYAESVTRKIDGQNFQSETRLVTTNHVLVLDSLTNGIAVGIQRNRQAGELISYRENGKDKLPDERQKFSERIAQRPVRFSETNWFSPEGTPQLPWAAVRESSSRVLLGMHEIESLPATPVKVGDEWRSNNPLGLRFRLVRTEQLDGKSCNVSEANAHDIHLRYWFCPTIGVIAKSEMEADYVTFAGRVHETVSLKLQEFRHDETTVQWLTSPDTQLGVLQTILVTPSIPANPELLAPALGSDNADTTSLALAVMNRRSMPIAANVASTLKAPPDPRIQRLTTPAEKSDPSCIPPTTPAERRMQVPGATIRYMETASLRGNPYILRVPNDYQPTGRAFPLIVYLSGGPGLAIDGANGAEDHLANTEYLVLYPNAGGEMWWTHDQATKVRALLDEVIPKLNVDPSRIYLVGFSNGGAGTLYYATLWPDQFSAIAPLMGAANCIDEIRPLALNKLSKVPALFVHGDKDPIIPSSCSEDAYKVLRKFSPVSELHILKGHEHDITLGNDDGLTLPFLQSHPRCTLPPARN